MRRAKRGVSSRGTSSATVQGAWGEHLNLVGALPPLALLACVVASLNVPTVPRSHTPCSRRGSSHRAG